MLLLVSTVILCATALPGTGSGREGVNDPVLDDGAHSWLDLDRAIAALAPAPESDGPTWGALLRTFYTHSPKEASGGTTDISGQNLEDARVWISSTAGDVAWRVSANIASGDARLEHAYASWQLEEWLGLTAGQFKPRVVRSGAIPEEGLLFRERTFLGAAFDGRDDGVELGGHYDQFDYWLAVTDGDNGQSADHFWSARGEWAVYDAAGPDVEGARGSPNYLRVLLGAYTFQDVSQSAHNGGGLGADFALTFGPWAVHWEWARLDQNFSRTIDVFNGLLLALGDGQPNSVTLSVRVLEEGELAVRAERADDADHTSSVGAAASWTPGGGPARFIADVSKVEADSLDFSMFSLGVVLGSTGLGRPFTH